MPARQTDVNGKNYCGENRLDNNNSSTSKLFWRLHHSVWQTSIYLTNISNALALGLYTHENMKAIDENMFNRLVNIGYFNFFYLISKYSTVM